MITSNLHHELARLILDYENELVFFQNGKNSSSISLQPVFDISEATSLLDVLSLKSNLEINISSLRLVNQVRIDNQINSKTKKKSLNTEGVSIERVSGTNYVPRYVRLLRKLRRDPYSYFYDCSNPLERSLRFLFRKNI